MCAARRTCFSRLTPLSSNFAQSSALDPQRSTSTSALALARASTRKNVRSASCSHQCRLAPQMSLAAYGFCRASCQTKPSPADIRHPSSSDGSSGTANRSPCRASAKIPSQYSSSRSRKESSRKGVPANRSASVSGSAESLAASSRGSSCRQLRAPASRFSKLRNALFRERTFSKSAAPGPINSICDSPRACAFFPAMPSYAIVD